MTESLTTIHVAKTSLALVLPPCHQLAVLKKMVRKHPIKPSQAKKG
jgi:hypothetical protein